MPKCIHVSEITVFQYCVLVTESLECPCLENLNSLKVNIFHWLPSVLTSGTLTEMRECLEGASGSTPSRGQPLVEVTVPELSA